MGCSGSKSAPPPVAEDAHKAVPPADAPKKTPPVSPKLSPKPSPKLSPKQPAPLAQPAPLTLEVSTPAVIDVAPVSPKRRSSGDFSPRGLAKQLSGMLSSKERRSSKDPLPDLPEGSAPKSPADGAPGRRSSRDEQTAAELSDRSRAHSASTGLSLREQSLTPEMLVRWEADMTFTPEQEAAMAEFRRRAVEEGVLTEPFDNKPTFYRFCQARGYDVDKAMAMFCDHMAWRKKWNLDEGFVVTEFGRVPKQLFDFKYPEKPALKRAYNFVHHKTDKLGRLMYVDKSGSINLAALKAAVGGGDGDWMGRLLETFVFDCEVTMQFRLPGCSVAAGKFVGKTLTIVDLQGFAISKFDKDMRDYLKAISKLSQDNYPELLGKMVIINTPWVFKAVWNFVSPMLDKRTRDKISMVGGAKEYTPKLLELVDRADLPDFLGGDDPTCDFVTENGPWMDIVNKVASGGENVAART